MIVLYQFEISPFCDKVRRILHVKGQSYRVEEVSLARSRRAVPKINPAGKLPTLEHDGRIVPDSTTIAYYLEREFPEPALIPAGAEERAHCHVLEDWADESLYFTEMRLRFSLPHNAARWGPELAKHDAWPVRLLAPRLLPRLLGRQLVAQGIGRKPIDAVLDDLVRHIDALAGLLGRRDWLVGSQLTLADIAVFAQLFCIAGAEEGKARIDKVPAVADWMERVDAATAQNP